MAYTNLTDNGSTSSVVVTGGKVFVSATGDWGTSGSLALQFLDDQGTPAWVTITSWTADIGTAVELGPGKFTVRATLSSATSPDLDVTIR